MTSPRNGWPVTTAPVVIPPVIDSDTSDGAGGAFAGVVRFVRIGTLVYVFGAINRAAGFNAAFVGTGVVLPPDCLPVGNVTLPAAPFFNPAVGESYQFRVNPAVGVLEVRQAAASTQDMIVNAVYSTT